MHKDVVGRWYEEMWNGWNEAVFDRILDPEIERVSASETMSVSARNLAETTACTTRRHGYTRMHHIAEDRTA